jgi:hypothetical protein
LQNLQADNVALRTALGQRNSVVSAADSQSRTFDNDIEDTLTSTIAAAVAAIEWGANQSATYEFGELPLGDRRLATMEAVSERLQAIGFAGTVQLESHIGDFCMISIGTGNYELAPGDIEASLCNVIGFDAAESVRFGLRQSVAFANFVNTSRERTQGRIGFEVISLGNSEPAYSYPNSIAAVNAGSWNDVAALNNRVVVSIFADQDR